MRVILRGLYTYKFPIILNLIYVSSNWDSFKHMLVEKLTFNYSLKEKLNNGKKQKREPETFIFFFLISIGYERLAPS